MTYAQAAKCHGGNGIFIPADGWIASKDWVTRATGRLPKRISRDIPGRSAGFSFEDYLAPFMTAEKTPLDRLGDGLGGFSPDLILSCDMTTWFQCRKGFISAIQQQYEPLLEGLRVVRIEYLPGYANNSDVDAWCAVKNADRESVFPVGGIDNTGTLITVIGPRAP